MMLAMEDGDVERGNERGTGSPADELGWTASSLRFILDQVHRSNKTTEKKSKSWN